MRDFNGIKLVVGDRVAFVEPNTHLLQMGTVYGSTPQGIRITPDNPKLVIMRYGVDPLEYLVRDYKQVSKVG